MHAVAKITKKSKIHCISEKAVNGERKSSTKFVIFVKTANWKKIGKFQQNSEIC